MLPLNFQASAFFRLEISIHLHISRNAKILLACYLSKQYIFVLWGEFAYYHVPNESGFKNITTRTNTKEGVYSQQWWAMNQACLSEQQIKGSSLKAISKKQILFIFFLAGAK